MSTPAAAARDQAERDQEWRFSASLVIGSSLLVLLVFRNTVGTMVGIWRFGTFSHCYVILPITIYLIWSRRSSLKLIQPTPNYVALALVMLFTAAWLLGKSADVHVVQEVSVVAMLPALVWLILGSAVGRILLFPLIFLLFAAPVGDFLIAPLQDFTAAFVVKALQLSGVAVLREGRLLTVPSGTWEVAEACSGLRYLISTFVVGTLFAWLAYRTWFRRLLFCLICVVTAILANGMRAYGILMLAELTNRQLAGNVDHILYGWLFFLLIASLLFWLGLQWRENQLSSLTNSIDLPQEYSSAAPNTAPSSLPKIRPMLAALAGTAIVASAPLCAHALSRRSDPRPPHLAAPAASPAWQPRPGDPGNWRPLFVGADQELSQTYAASDRRVYLYVAYYGSHRSGFQLVSRSNMLFDKQSGVRIGGGSRQISWTSGDLAVEETVIRSPSTTTKMVVWRVYWVQDRFTSSPYYAKFLQAEGWLLGRAPQSAAIVVAADYPVDPIEAVDALKDFWVDASIRDALERATP